MRKNPAVALLALALASCGNDTTTWEDGYRARLGTLYAGLPAADLAQVCANAATLDDTELRADLSVAAGDGSEFDRFAAEVGFVPTAADYTTALGIAVETMRAQCG
jgi:hypothetical protein